MLSPQGCQNQSHYCLGRLQIILKTDRETPHKGWLPWDKIKIYVLHYDGQSEVQFQTKIIIIIKANIMNNKIMFVIIEIIKYFKSNLFISLTPFQLQIGKGNHTFLSYTLSVKQSIL